MKLTRSFVLIALFVLSYAAEGSSFLPVPGTKISRSFSIVPKDQKERNAFRSFRSATTTCGDSLSGEGNEVVDIIGSNGNKNNKKRNKTVVVSESKFRKFDSRDYVYVTLTSTFVTCLIIADVIGVKLFSIRLPFNLGVVDHTCGMLTFPVTFVIGDVINEYYGSAATKATVWMGLVMSVLTFVMIELASMMPFLDKPFNVAPEAFNMIFGSAKLMFIASICAYFIGQQLDIWLFRVLKKVSRGNFLWLRATGSSVISQVLDSFLVSYINFSLGKSLLKQEAATMSEVLHIAGTGYVLKMLMTIVLTPALYAIRNLLKSQYGLVPLDCDDEDV